MLARVRAMVKVSSCQCWLQLGSVSNSQMVRVRVRDGNRVRVRDGNNRHVSYFVHWS